MYYKDQKGLGLPVKHKFRLAVKLEYAFSVIQNASNQFEFCTIWTAY